MNNLQLLLLGIVSCTLVLCAVGTTDYIAEPQDPNIEPVTHTVIAGDTVQSIAKEYYNDSEQFERILLANGNMEYANMFKVGTVLIIPAPRMREDPNDNTRRQVNVDRQSARSTARQPTPPVAGDSNIGPGGIEWALVTQLQIDCITSKGQVRKTPVTYYCDSMDMIFVHINPPASLESPLLRELGFYIAATEVTRLQWRNIMDPESADLKPEHRDLPVSGVSWSQAVDFCKKLSQTTGRYYRLPLQAQWEYACRAQTTTKYHCGHTISSKWANFRPSTGVTAVGAYPANLFGIYDTHGNVSEWCLDEYKLGQKIMRGGSFRSFPGDLACSESAYSSPADKSIGNGFRLLLDIEQ